MNDLPLLPASQRSLHAAAERLEAHRGEATPYCEVDIVTAAEMTVERLSDLVQIGRPVLIKGGVNASWDLDAFRPGNFSEMYGGKPVSLAGIPYSSEFGQQRVSAPVAQWLRYAASGDIAFLSQMGIGADPSLGGGVTGSVTDHQQQQIEGKDVQRGETQGMSGRVACTAEPSVTPAGL